MNDYKCFLWLKCFRFDMLILTRLLVTQAPYSPTEAIRCCLISLLINTSFRAASSHFRLMLSWFLCFYLWIFIVCNHWYRLHLLLRHLVRRLSLISVQINLSIFTLYFDFVVFFSNFVFMFVLRAPSPNRCIKRVLSCS